MNASQLNENEYAPFYANYIINLGNVNLIEVLNSSFDDFLNTLSDLPEEKLMYRYAYGKWTIKELIQHIIDAERVMTYRALRFSRKDTTEVPGFDEDWYVANSNGNDRSLEELLEEFTFIRKASISLFNSFNIEMLTRFGTANGNDISVRALGFIIAGHQMHHLKIIKEKYL
ncbi:DinB family protein [Lutibacter sp.]|uniref:DinB family protein n=1 Tax=Lutibacter sp. TaxID=1925666 RepID=UPI0027332521|nr:DinB family protein [Lutibacter sp.]MDP3312711.1 DinB family protein [Lutibacter sp.]